MRADVLYAQSLSDILNTLDELSAQHQPSVTDCSGEALWDDKPLCAFTDNDQQN